MFITTFKISYLESKHYLALLLWFYCVLTTKERVWGKICGCFSTVYDGWFLLILHTKPNWSQFIIAPFDTVNNDVHQSGVLYVSHCPSKALCCYDDKGTALPPHLTYTSILDSKQQDLKHYIIMVMVYTSWMDTYWDRKDSGTENGGKWK